MLTLSDYFCGAGGSSSGAKMVPGVQVTHAFNHWQLALDTHALNHPEVEHNKADLSKADPRKYPRTNIGWFSPECTNHSQAKGKRKHDRQPDLFEETLPDEAAERSRSTMKDVLTFTAVHRYEAVIVENVVEVRDWAWWPIWIRELGLLGYDHEIVYLNSMHAQQLGDGAPQSRDRIYIVAWKKGNRRPNLRKWTRPPAYCQPCDQVVTPIQAWKKAERQYGKFGAQYVYRCPNLRCRNSVVTPGFLPAAAAIDWSVPGQRIGDRAKPLAPKTMARIRKGLATYGDRLLVPCGGTWRTKAEPVGKPMATRTTTETDGLLVPVEGRTGTNARLTTGVFRAQTARLQDALVVPLRNNAVARPASTDPLMTVAAEGNHHMIVDYNGPARPVSHPMPTQTTVEGNAVASVEIKAEDCLFRMLEPHEVQAAMAFDPGYRLLGTRRERVRQLGNAVTPPAARDLIAAIVEAITGELVKA